MKAELSSLPDEILLHILSFLESQDAVRTSVVGRRWRHLWRALPALRIHSDSFRDYPSFSTFVHTLLLRCSSSPPLSLCSFSFDFSNPLHLYSSSSSHPDLFDFEPLLSALIRHLHRRRARHLSLLFPRIVDDLPLLLSSPSLSSLHLHHLVILPASLHLRLATLTSLHLVNCSFVIHCEDLFDPFKDFVCLADLLICNCRIPSKVKVLEISAPQLASLTISDMEYDRNLSPHCRILLSSTRIASFNFTASHVLKLCAASLPRIERAYLDVAMIYYLFGDNPLLTARNKFISRLIDMFRVVGDATAVTLSLQTMRILALFPDALRLPSPLTGMKILKLKVPREPGSFTMPADVISFLLNGSPAAAFKVEFCKASAKQEHGRELTAGLPKFVSCVSTLRSGGQGGMLI